MRVLPPLMAACLVLAMASSALAVEDLSNREGCELASECFRQALTSADTTLSSQDRLGLKIDRLRLVQERHPGSVWAGRAGLLIGLLMSERDPAEAIRFLRTAQRDLPILEDYIRLWIGESLLKLGEASQAAALLESIPELVPDTVLRTRILFRVGEAWAQAGQCRKALESLERAVAAAPLESAAPVALLLVADCQRRENRIAESRAALRQLWVRYPNSPEARLAAARLAEENGAWQPTPDELYSRAVSLSTLALHAEAVGAFQQYLAVAPVSRRDEARLKLGISLVRLRRYEQAREVFQSLAASNSRETGEAAVWLARIYLRQGDGERLLALANGPFKPSLSGEQKATILMLAANWLEDQGQDDQALAKYRRVAQSLDAAGQRLEALWRVGWLQYRYGQYESALESFQEILARHDERMAAQILYWIARTRERLGDQKASDSYLTLCQQYVYTYYCHLARVGGKLQAPISPAFATSLPELGLDAGRPMLGRDRRYLRALELKWFGLEQDAARELTVLADRYARDRTALLELAALLSDVGASHQALRVAKLHFRDSLERGGEELPLALWHAAYPTIYLPVIRTYAGKLVDPFLVAAIIREESQYDTRALSRVGAIGLMQVMPATAEALAAKLGVAELERDDLFDQEINIRVGVSYLGQLLERFSGNVLYAVAAYNAGPQAVSAWAAKYGDKDPDEFVELIPYQETRQYVKRVLRSYREYFRLVGTPCTAASLDKVC